MWVSVDCFFDPIWLGHRGWYLLYQKQKHCCQLELNFVLEAAKEMRRMFQKMGYFTMSIISSFSNVEVLGQTFLYVFWVPIVCSRVKGNGTWSPPLPDGTEWRCVAAVLLSSSAAVSFIENAALAGRWGARVAQNYPNLHLCSSISPLKQMFWRLEYAACIFRGNHRALLRWVPT